MDSCTNCCEDIEEGKTIFDEEGNPFCSQNHLDLYYEGDET